MVFNIVLKLNSDKRHKTKVNTCLRKDDITRHIERTQCGLQSEKWLGKKPGRYSELQHVLLLAVGGSTLHTTSCVRHAGEQICLLKERKRFQREAFLHCSTKPSVLVAAVFVSIQNDSLFTAHDSHNNLSSIC